MFCHVMSCYVFRCRAFPCLSFPRTHSSNPPISHSYSRYKNELIMFAWNFKKAEDPFVRNWACLNAARFLAQMEVDPASKDAATTSNLAFQIYNQLLKSFKTEGRDLVNTALDAIIPVLPIRLKGDKFHKLMRLTKKITNEECGNIPHLVMVWGTICRHWKIFYGYRYVHHSRSLSTLSITPPLKNIIQAKTNILLTTYLLLLIDTIL